MAFHRGSSRWKQMWFGIGAEMGGAEMGTGPFFIIPCQVTPFRIFLRENSGLIEILGH